jgi:hypothetical protein
MEPQGEQALGKPFWPALVVPSPGRAFPFHMSSNFNLGPRRYQQRYQFISAPAHLTGAEAWLKAPIDVLKWEDISIEHGLAVVILALRDMDYRTEYLATEHWHGIRERALMKSNWQCVCCHKDATDGHHIIYDRLGFEWIEDVVGVCRGCHDIHHKSLRAQIAASLRQYN